MLSDSCPEPSCSATLTTKGNPGWLILVINICIAYVKVKWDSFLWWYLQLLQTFPSKTVIFKRAQIYGFLKEHLRKHLKVIWPMESTNQPFHKSFCHSDSCLKMVHKINAYKHRWEEYTNRKTQKSGSNKLRQRKDRTWAELTDFYINNISSFPWKTQYGKFSNPTRLEN